VRPEPIDSTKELLDPPQILLEFMRRYGTGDVPLQAALAGFIHELNMDDAEAIQFGNTAFITHYADDDGKTLVYMRALNVDTAANFVDNIEYYVSYLYRRGVKVIVTNYSDPTVTSAIKAAHRRIEANNPQGGATLEFTQEGEETIATITQYIKGEQ
jgi:hypothetical protein